MSTLGDKEKIEKAALGAAMRFQEAKSVQTGLPVGPADGMMLTAVAGHRTEQLEGARLNVGALSSQRYDGGYPAEILQRLAAGAVGRPVRGASRRTDSTTEMPARREAGH